MIHSPSQKKGIYAPCVPLLFWKKAKLLAWGNLPVGKFLDPNSTAVRVNPALGLQIDITFVPGEIAFVPGM